MSRIHDALKKAQLEKNSVSLPEVPPNTGEGASFDRQGGEGLPLLDPDSPVFSRSLASDRTSEAGEVDGFSLERCARRTWAPDRRTMLHFDRRNPAACLEEFRTLRSHLNLIRKNLPLQKLLITSPLRGEGKTFVAANLAHTMVRQQACRVLLIDADLRSARMHVSLGAASAPGLVDYLAGETDELSVLQRGPLANLFFIPRGRPAPNPSELISNGRLKILVHRLTPVFDWIILDSPPAVPVSDSKLLADLCDGVLLVVRCGSTPYDLAQKVCKEFGDKRLLGAVVNCAEAESIYSTYLYSDQADDKPKSAKAKGVNA